jgi:biotin synthase-related radical SAM superfamily protein
MRNGIRVSYGSAVEVGLVEGRLAARPRTAYLFLSNGACRGRCAFCPQSMGGFSDRVSRVRWPNFPLDSVLEAINSSRSVERVCLQCADEPWVKGEIPYLVRRLAATRGIPVSVSIPPVEVGLMEELKDAGAERLTVPIDCASPRLFHAVKGRRMVDCLDALRSAVAVFGRGRTGTHVIVGLGETEKEAVSLLAQLWAMGVRPSLFAFTPVKGTAMEGRQQPAIAAYRRLQLAMHMIVELGVRGEGFTFDGRGRLAGYPVDRSDLASIAREGRPFETGGCPGCNRPYFNERVSGPLFNFPYPPTEVEIKCIEEELLGNTSAD